MAVSPLVLATADSEGKNFPSNGVDDDQAEIVTRFLELLGSTSRQLQHSHGELKDLLSTNVQENDFVCCLPSFRVVGEAEEARFVDEEREPSVLWNSLEKGVRSVLGMPMSNVNDEKIEEHFSKEEDLSCEQYTKATIDAAPLDLLRKLQEALRSYTHCRLDEWKIILEHHDSEEAKELVKLLKYHKMIVGCRGNTSIHVVSTLVEDGTEDSSESLSEPGTVETDESSSDSSLIGNQGSAVACKLHLEFFVKLRHGPRTFATSCFTLAFDSVGVAQYSLDAIDGKLTNISFECNEREIMESMRAKANALVLQAVAFQAADTVRWSKTFLSDLWEAFHMMRDEDSLSGSVSGHSFSTFGTIASYISALTTNSRGVAECSKPTSRTIKKKLRHFSPSFAIPADITTTKRVHARNSCREGGNPWQQSVVFQIVAFLFLFGLCIQFMALKSFCHSLFQHEYRLPILNGYEGSLRGGDAVERSPKGVSFHRVISTFPGDSKFVLELEDSDKHCKMTDFFGVNDCHYNWKEEAAGNYSTTISTVLDKESYIEAHLTLDGIPYKLHCSLCGQPCEIGLPVIDFTYTFKMPDCPVDLRNHFQDFEYQLWSHSPTEGVVVVSLEGNATVYSAPNKILAAFEVEGTIR